MRAVLRKLRADLRNNRVQRIFIAVLLMFATAALTASLMIQLRGATAWEELFEESNGADIWFYGPPDLIAEITAREGIAEASGPYEFSRVVVPGISSPSPEGYQIFLFGAGVEPPSMGGPVLTDGRWPQATGEIVLPRKVARDFGFSVGQTMEVETSSGSHELRVVGLSLFAGRSPFAFPQIAWTNEPTVRATGSIEPPFSALAVQLESRGLTSSFIEALTTEQEQLKENFFIEDWRQVGSDNDEATEVIAVFLGIFSAFALISAGFVIVNAISGRVLARYRDIGLMKAIGFTPRQVAAGLLIEHWALAIIGVAGGLLLGTWLVTILEDPATKEFETGSLVYFRPSLGIAIALGVVAIVTLATLIPAWHAGRIPVVEAVILGPTRVSNRPSRLAAAGRALHLPSWMVTGVKDSFDRPLRSWVTVAALILSVVTLTFVVTAEWTIRQLTERPELIGEPFDLVVGVGSPGPRDDGRPLVDAREIEGVIQADLAVDHYFERVLLPVAIPGEDDQITLAAVGPGYDELDWVVSRGRLFSAPGEATVGKGFLDVTGAKIGDTVEISVLGKPVRLKIVGMHRVAEDNGRSAMTSLETLREQVDPAFEAESYAIVLKDGASLQLAVERYIAAGSRSIESYDHTAEGIGGVRAVLAGLGAMLLLVGLVSLVNTISIGVRERRRDLGVLKAIGFTPSQLIGSVLSGAFVLTSIALAAGIPLGLWISMRISDQLGDQLGWGPGLFEMPPATWLICIVPAFALTVALAALVPGMFAARLRANEALRTE